MIRYKQYLKIPVLLAGIILAMSSFLRDRGHEREGGHEPDGTYEKAGRNETFPYKKAGLTERQAAAHLLSRFTYGAQPGEVGELVKKGLEKWFTEQLNAGLPDDTLQEMLKGYDALNLTNEQVVNMYPKNGQVIRMAVRDGYVDKDSVKTDRKAYRDIIKEYMEKNGYKPEQELFRQFVSQKVLRAAYSRNQLQEVMTDFWFNHFNVSLTKNDCASFIPAYERDVIRPGALGHFEDLLLNTAKSPAMLYYLDNFSSSGPAPEMAGLAGRGGIRNSGGARNNRQTDREEQLAQQGLNAVGKDKALDSSTVNQLQKARKTRGLNENYAREVMELHTLGVDGGYTQQDVTQAARVLTGWTVYPLQKEGKAFAGQIGDDRMARKGFVHDGDFFFNANRHDNGEKTVLGRQFGPDGGYQEGIELLKMLAHHPSTAHFVCHKIAVRFVSDDPAPALVDRMVKTWLDKDGDIRQVLLTMVNSPEFWSVSAIREKTKSPFELVIGSVRALQARIDQPHLLYNWIAKMGEKKYYYQAPTGFPDKGAYWINTGALLYRMNFGLAFASGRIPGVTLDLAALNNHHEPESAQAALTIYCKLMMPGRDLDATIRRLTPMLSEPELAKKVDAAVTEREQSNTGQQDMKMENPDGGKARPLAGNSPGHAQIPDNPMLAQVVGIIIGSPEYQRR